MLLVSYRLSPIVLENAFHESPCFEFSRQMTDTSYIYFWMSNPALIDFIRQEFTFTMLYDSILVWYTSWAVYFTDNVEGLTQFFVQLDESATEVRQCSEELYILRIPFL